MEPHDSAAQLHPHPPQGGPGDKPLPASHPEGIRPLCHWVWPLSRRMHQSLTPSRCLEAAGAELQAGLGAQDGVDPGLGQGDQGRERHRQSARTRPRPLTEGRAVRRAGQGPPRPVWLLVPPAGCGAPSPVTVPRGTHLAPVSGTERLGAAGLSLWGYPGPFSACFHDQGHVHRLYTTGQGQPGTSFSGQATRLSKGRSPRLPTSWQVHLPPAPPTRSFFFHADAGFRDFMP